MAKKVSAIIKLQVAAGSANPSPPVGPALGQHGVNIMEFCKAFNAQTDNLEKGAPVPVEITVFEDRSFTFITKTPPASFLLKKAAGIKSGSGRPNTEKVGTVTREQLEEIAKTKEPDLTAADLDAAVRTIAGSARAMGRLATRLGNNASKFKIRWPSVRLHDTLPFDNSKTNIAEREGQSSYIESGKMQNITQTFLKIQNLSRILRKSLKMQILLEC